MKIPNDRELAQLMRDGEQRRLESGPGARRGLLFLHALHILCLALGMGALVYATYAIYNGTPPGMPKILAKKLRPMRSFSQ